MPLKCYQSGLHHITVNTIAGTCLPSSSSVMKLPVVSLWDKMYTVYSLNETAESDWTAIGWPWSCDFRAISHWKEANQLVSKPTQWDIICSHVIQKPSQGQFCPTFVLSQTVFSFSLTPGNSSFQPFQTHGLMVVGKSRTCKKKHVWSLTNFRISQQ